MPHQKVERFRKVDVWQVDQAALSHRYATRDGSPFAFFADLPGRAS
jgi:hypothetical protein